MSGAPYGTKSTQWDRAISKLLKDSKLSISMRDLFKDWSGECRASNKNLDFMPCQLSSYTERSISVINRAIKTALSEGLIIRISPACRLKNISAIYKLSDKWPTWATFTTSQKSAKFPYLSTKEESFSRNPLILSELKEGNTLPSLAALIPAMVPPEAPKKGLGWNPESEDELRKAYTSLVSCGVSVAGAKKAVNAAFKDGRLDRALEDLQVAKVWIKGQSWIQKPAAFLQRLVANERNHQRFRESMRNPKPNARAKAQGSVPRVLGPTPITETGMLESASGNRPTWASKPTARQAAYGLPKNEIRDGATILREHYGHDGNLWDDPWYRDGDGE